MCAERPADAVGAILASLSGHPHAIDSVVNQLTNNQLNAVLTSAARETTNVNPLGSPPEVFSYDTSRLVAIIDAVSTGANTVPGTQCKTRVFSAVALGPLSNILSHINSSGQAFPPEFSVRSQLADVSHALSVLIESDPQNIVQQLQNVHDYQALTNYAYAELQQGKPGRGQLGLLLLQLKFGSPPDPQNPYKYINDPGKYKDHQHALTLGFFLGCVDGAIRTDSQNAEDQQQATNNLIQNLWPIIGDVPLPGSEYVAQLGEAITSQYKGDLTQIENSNASFEKKLQDLATYTSDPQTGGLLSPGANSQFRSGFDEGNQTL